MDLEIIVPIEEGYDSAQLTSCLRGIVESTIIRSFTVSGVLIGRAKAPDSAFKAPWSCLNYEEPLVVSMQMAIENADAIHVAIVRTSYAIADKAWFGKMQLPFLRVPSCGLTVACDDQRGTGAMPFQIPVGWSPGNVVFGAQKTMASIARTVPNADGPYTDALLKAAAALGLAAWAIPGVRMSVNGALTSYARAESPNAHRPG